MIISQAEIIVSLVMNAQKIDSRGGRDNVGGGFQCEWNQYFFNGFEKFNYFFKFFSQFFPQSRFLHIFESLGGKIDGRLLIDGLILSQSPGDFENTASGICGVQSCSEERILIENIEESFD